MMATSRSSSRTHQQGLSLIELMLGMTIGLLIVASLTVVFVNSSRTNAETEKTSQQIENGRYAAQLLSDDLHLTGFYGEFDPATVATPGSKPDPCLTLPASLALAVALPIQGYDDGETVPSCLPTADLVANSDILVIRRASTCVAGSTGCDAVDVTKATYFQTGLCSADAGLYVIDTDASKFVLTKPPACGTVASPGPNTAALRAYYTHIYFVAKNNKAGDGIPTLKMLELGAGAFSSPISLVAGIDRMQIEYGVSATGTTPPVYTAAPVDTAAWRNVAAVKLHLLARNTAASAGYVDTKTYVLGKKLDGSDNSFGPASDAVKRHAYTTVVRLNNVAGRMP
jgi:type IV pilus assembly protein PilW